MKYPEPKNVRAYSQHQMQMFPPSVRSLIEDDHLCLVVDDVVKVLDLSCLYQKVSPEGNPAYHPAMMLKILFHSYASGIFSSRKIAKAMRENIAFIYLGAWQQPDFRTISDFRKNNLSELLPKRTGSSGYEKRCSCGRTVRVHVHVILSYVVGVRLDGDPELVPGRGLRHGKFAMFARVGGIYL